MDQLDAAYREELSKFEEALDATIALSLQQHGIETDGRGLRAMKVFTRQTLVAIRLAKLLPFSRQANDPEGGFWDVCSVASLTRNLMEGYVALFYSGTEAVGEEEAELRFLLGLSPQSRMAENSKAKNTKFPRDCTDRRAA